MGNKEIHGILLSKFPDFDPTWTPDAQASWFDAFSKITKMVLGNKETVKPLPPKPRGRPPKTSDPGSKKEAPFDVEQWRAKRAQELTCLRPNVPTISRTSCADWRKRWEGSTMNPALAMEKLKPCRECENG